VSFGATGNNNASGRRNVSLNRRSTPSKTDNGNAGDGQSSSTPVPAPSFGNGGGFGSTTSGTVPAFDTPPLATNGTEEKDKAEAIPFGGGNDAVSFDFGNKGFGDVGTSSNSAPAAPFGSNSAPAASFDTPPVATNGTEAQGNSNGLSFGNSSAPVMFGTPATDSDKVPVQQPTKTATNPKPIFTPEGAPQNPHHLNTDAQPGEDPLALEVMRRRLTALYTTCTPAKLPKLDAAIAKYGKAGPAGFCKMSLTLGKKYPEQWTHVNPNSVAPHNSQSPNKAATKSPAAPAASFSSNQSVGAVTFGGGGGGGAYGAASGDGAASATGVGSGGCTHGA
jgi:hypothetical protein